MDQKSNESNPLPGWLGTLESSGTKPAPGADETIRKAVAEVMSIHDVTLGGERQPTRIRGTLMVSAEEAFYKLRPQFEAVGYTPHMRREEDMDVIRALPGVFGRSKTNPTLAIILLMLTIISVFWVGLFQSGDFYDPPDAVIYAKLTGNTSALQHPNLLPTDDQLRNSLFEAGLYAAALLGILGSHEMGHYILARRNKVKTTLPFFIPMPIPPLGTMGAVIAMREPAPNRKVQFDIGIAGPLAGLIVALPIMIFGLSRSHVGTVEQEIAKMPPEIAKDADQLRFTAEGQSILYLAIKYLMFGEILPQGDRDVWIDGVAFAAWAGFLVTMLNLIPAGQLDGGHIMFGILGEKASKLRVPIMIILTLLAIPGVLYEFTGVDLGFGWVGWALWVVIIWRFLRGHAPVLDEITGLDSQRRALGIMMMVLFVLIFMPTPIRTIPSTPLFSLFGQS
jgi:Zn-dependent protease